MKASSNKAGTKALSEFAADALKAMRRAHRAAVRENTRYGLPMIYSKNGRIITVSTRKLPWKLSTLREIEAAIAKLPAIEFRKLFEKLKERDAAEWDFQIERDAHNGNLDRLHRRVTKAKARKPKPRLKKSLTHESPHNRRRQPTWMQ